MADVVRNAWCCLVSVGLVFGCGNGATTTDPGPGGAGGSAATAGTGGSGGRGSDRLCAGGSSRCVVTTQTPELTIEQSGRGTLFILNGSSQSLEQLQYSEALTGPIESFPVPASAGLVPRQSYQWAFLLDGEPNTNAVWQSFTVDFVRAGREPVDTFGPISVGLSSQTVRTGLASQAVQTASGRVQIGLTHRGAYLGTATGAPYFVEDPSGALPSGWVLTGVDGNVPWVRIEAADGGGTGGRGGGGGAGGMGGSGGTSDPVRSVVLQAFDGSLLQYTHQGGGSGSWSPPIGLGRPHGAYGSLRLSEDQQTFTWSSGTNVVTFEQASPGLWLARTAQVVLPGSGEISPGLQVSWDSEGRLKTISDQSSVDANGQPKRVATLRYGGDSACPKQADPGYVVAPEGKLCALEHMDGTVAEVQYVTVSSVPEQLGRVKLPGGAVWSYSWRTQSVETDGKQVSYAQLLSVQTPRGYDAQQKGMMTRDDTVWSVVYEGGPFGSAAPEGLVSPLPTQGADPSERLGRAYAFATLDSPSQASVHWGVISGSPGSFSLTAGAKIQTLSFDAAWRRTGLTEFLDDTTSYTTSLVWDEALDQPRSVTFAGATQTQGYDFLGRPSTLQGPGSTESLTNYDQGALRGLVGTLYDNATLAAPGVGSVLYSVTDGSGQVTVKSESLPVGVTQGSFSIELRAYVEAPSSGSLSYSLSTDEHSTATLYVNGSCASSGTPTTPCPANNTASTPSTTEAEDPIQLVVQYVRDGTAVSGSAPIEVTLEGPGVAKTETEAGLQSGLGLRSSVSATETLSVGAQAVTLTRSTVWDDGLFRTQASQTLPGLDGKRVTIPRYEQSYAPAQSEWKRPVSITSPGSSTYRLSYWDNTETPLAGGCSGTEDVVQAGQDKTRVYPAPSDGSATGLERRRVYDAAGRLARFEVVPEGMSSGVSGCQSFDGRGRSLGGSIEAYSEGSTGGGARSEAWVYPDQTDGFTRRVTHTWEAPPTTPSCATETVAPYTCSQERAVDLLGRTTKQTDVWGTERTSNYVFDASTGERTETDTLMLSDRTVTTTRVRNRLGNSLSLTRTDTEPDASSLSATYSYDEFGRAQTVETQSNGTEVVTATFGYDGQSRVDKVTWTRGQAPNQVTVLEDSLTLADNSSRTLGESFVYGQASYGYEYTFNEAGWLTQATLSGTDAGGQPVNGSWTYRYEASSGTNPDAYLNGNVTEVVTTGVASGPSDTFVYDYFDRLEGSGVSHDGLGNLTAYGGTTLTYDQTNQVKSLSDGATTVTFMRTPRGNVYQKSTDTTPIRYALDGFVLDESGKPITQTLTVGTLLVTLDLTDTSNNTFTVASLQGGHALLALDGSGSPVAPNEIELTLYGPWGHAVQAAPTPSADRPLYGWQGLLRLETNLDFVLMGERMYHQALGRFTSVDPVFQGGLTAYSYARNDFVNNTDPRGTLSASFNDPVFRFLVSEAPDVFVLTVGGGYLLGRRLFGPVEPPVQQEQRSGSDDLIKVGSNFEQNRDLLANESPQNFDLRWTFDQRNNPDLSKKVDEDREKLKQELNEQKQLKEEVVYESDDPFMWLSDE